MDTTTSSTNDIGWLLTSDGYWHQLVIDIGWLLTSDGYWHRMVIDISWLLTLAGYWHRLVIDNRAGYWHSWNIRKANKVFTLLFLPDSTMKWVPKVPSSSVCTPSRCWLPCQRPTSACHTTSSASLVRLLRSRLARFITWRRGNSSFTILLNIREFSQNWKKRFFRKKTTDATTGDGAKWSIDPFAIPHKVIKSRNEMCTLARIRSQIVVVLRYIFILSVWKKLMETVMFCRKRLKEVAASSSYGQKLETIHCFIKRTNKLYSYVTTFSINYPWLENNFVVITD